MSDTIRQFRRVAGLLLLAATAASAGEPEARELLAVWERPRPSAHVVYTETTVRSTDVIREEIRATERRIPTEAEVPSGAVHLTQRVELWSGRDGMRVDAEFEPGAPAMFGGGSVTVTGPSGTQESSTFLPHVDGSRSPPLGLVGGTRQRPRGLGDSKFMPALLALRPLDPIISPLGRFPDSVRDLLRTSDSRVIAVGGRRILEFDVDYNSPKRSGPILKFRFDPSRDGLPVAVMISWPDGRISLRIEVELVEEEGRWRPSGWTYRDYELPPGAVEPVLHDRTSAEVHTWEWGGTVDPSLYKIAWPPGTIIETYDGTRVRTTPKVGFWWSHPRISVLILLTLSGLLIAVLYVLFRGRVAAKSSRSHPST